VWQQGGCDSAAAAAAAAAASCRQRGVGGGTNNQQSTKSSDCSGDGNGVDDSDDDDNGNKGNGGNLRGPVTPIWRHYDANNALLGIFALAYFGNGNVCLAYAVRRRFVEVTLYRIPRHGNYTSGSEG
jgi:hypothetical protein